MEFIDKSGQPRSIDDLQDAKRTIELWMMSKDALKFPSLFVACPVIRDALRELMAIRAQPPPPAEGKCGSSEDNLRKALAHIMACHAPGGDCARAWAKAALRGDDMGTIQHPEDTP